MSSIDWKKIHEVRESAAALLQAVDELGGVGQVILESFRDWDALRGRLELIATPSDGDEVLNLADVMEATGLDSIEISAGMIRGRFPYPVFDQPEVQWAPSDIAAWKGDK